MDSRKTQNEVRTLKSWSRPAIVHSICMLVFTAFACFVLFQIGQAVKAMGEATSKLAARVDGIGAKIEQVTGSAAKVSKNVETLAESIDRLAKKVDAANRLAGNLKRDGAALTPDEERVINRLLLEVRGSGLRFVRSGKNYSALTTYAWLWAKYKILKSTISTADDFIAKVGTKELVGDPYEVEMADGTRKPLAEWLDKRLTEVRKEPAAKRDEKVQ